MEEAARSRLDSGGKQGSWDSLQRWLFYSMLGFWALISRLEESRWNSTGLVSGGFWSSLGGRDRLDSPNENHLTAPIINHSSIK